MFDCFPCAYTFGFRRSLRSVTVRCLGRREAFLENQVLSEDAGDEFLLLLSMTTALWVHPTIIRLMVDCRS